ncbi:MAG: DUF4070 domain-containing protein [Planctomycetes bacterium]|nr:DUF4070 domain-containing protein [Planctomycetota bacterium]
MQRKVRCLLIYPRFSEYSFWNFSFVARIRGCRYNMPPLGLLTVAALLPANWEFRLADLNTCDLNPADVDWADVVFTGGMITQRLEVLRLIKMVHEHNKPVVVGGPDCTSVPGWYHEADFLVLDEAEITLPDFIKAWEAGEKSGRFEAHGRKPDVTQSPIPRFDLARFSNYLYIGIQCSRGCPYTCEFCDIIELYGRVPRFKTPDQIIVELNTLYEAGYRGHVDFVDDNFIGNKKAAKELLTRIIAWQDERNWPFFFSTEATITLASDPVMLDLMKRADFRGIFVGIETPDPAILRQTQKKQNTLKPIADSIRKINESGMLVLAGFILGFDEEKPGAGEALVACVEETRIGVAMTGLLASLPNTQLERRLAREGRALMRPESGPGMRPEELDQMTAGLNFVTRRPRIEILKEYSNALKRIYSPKSFFERVRGFLQWYKGYPHGMQSAGSISSMLIGLLNINMRYLVRPRLWPQYLRTMFAGLRHSGIGFARAAQMSAFFLHLERQTAHVVKLIDQQIAELDANGEEGYLRRRNFAVQPATMLTPGKAPVPLALTPAHELTPVGS